MIQPESYNASLESLFRLRGFESRCLTEVDGHPIFAFRRASNREVDAPIRIYLSSGVHGDEPAGPLAIAHLLEKDHLPEDCELTVIPLVNPSGFDRQSRENAAGVDLNRDFRYPQSPESQALKSYIDSQAPFDLSLSLHEDWESKGFYLYSLGSDEDRIKARNILEAAATAGPIDLSPEIDGSPASGGLIDLPADFDIESRDDWPEAFLLYSKSRHAHYTLESPSSAPLQQRVAQHLAAALKAIELHRQ